MNRGLFWTTFGTVFLAELGDKTQLASLLFASSREVPALIVFLGASAALVLSTGLAVLIGHELGTHLKVIPVKLIAGIGFVTIGGWTLLEHFRGA